jgi:antitoxin VapB
MMAGQKHVKLSRIGYRQVLQIPAELELPYGEATVRQDGARLVIEPLRRRGLLALLKAMKPLDENFPDFDDPVPGR